MAPILGVELEHCEIPPMDGPVQTRRFREPSQAGFGDWGPWGAGEIELNLTGPKV